MFNSRKLHKMKIYDHGLSPLLMQNPYSKCIFAIKTLYLLTDFQNLCRSCCDKLRSRCLQENIFTVLQESNISPKIQYQKSVFTHSYNHMSVKPQMRSGLLSPLRKLYPWLHIDHKAISLIRQGRCDGLVWWLIYIG